mmetsp:Transcript_84169/g.167992  ORF Transcript_84169/g.167992 Transcript_84169/m.167992 type:complete len:213 (-) Transcript_84169:1052-1690(-)
MEPSSKVCSSTLARRTSSTGTRILRFCRTAARRCWRSSTSASYALADRDCWRANSSFESSTGRVRFRERSASCLPSRLAAVSRRRISWPRLEATRALRAVPSIGAAMPCLLSASMRPASSAPSSDSLSAAVMLVLRARSISSPLAPGGTLTPFWRSRSMRKVSSLTRRASKASASRDSVREAIIAAVSTGGTTCASARARTSAAISAPLSAA